MLAHLKISAQYCDDSQKLSAEVMEKQYFKKVHRECRVKVFLPYLISSSDALIFHNASPECAGRFHGFSILHWQLRIFLVVIFRFIKCNILVIYLS